MKNTSFLALFLLGWFFAPAQITNRQNEVPQPIVTILKTEPEQPIEGGRLIVYFRFTNRIGNTLNGWIGAELFSGTSAPGQSPVDWPVINLEKDQSIDGAVMVNTTDAGINKKLQVYFYENQEKREDNSIRKSAPLYTIGEKEINIAALVNFRLNNFTINHTRAQTTDTDWGSLYAVVDDVPVMEPASFFMGNFKDGTYPFIGKNANNILIDPAETGPIPLVPGQNSRLYIAYTIYNGGGITDRTGFLNGYAEATANPIMFHGPRPGTSAAFQALKVINPIFNAIGACDGFVVMDTITINTNGIFTNTIRGDKDFSKRYNTEEYASQTGCGNTSDYVVSSSIRRMSYSRPSSSDPVAVYTKITANRTVSLTAKAESELRLFYEINLLEAEKNSRKMGIMTQVAPYTDLYDIKWEGTQTINPQGNIIEVNDRDYGYVSNGKYTAPARIARPLLIILRGNVIDKREDLKTQSLSVLNNGPLRQVTAIVQLIPGVTEMAPKENYTPPTADNKTEKNGEDYGNKDTASAIQKVITTYSPPFSLNGEWRYKITSSGGSVYTGIANLQQNGSTVTGRLNVNDNTKSAVSGSISGDVLNLSRDTGLETIQYYKLKKVNDTYFSGTYTNQGKYPDSGTVEFFK